ncbi:MAG: hypothetical protein ACOWWH_06755 [Eubacteriaceae bacterium]
MKLNKKYKIFTMVIFVIVVFIFLLTKFTGNSIASCEGIYTTAIYEANTITT